jgi:cobalt-zinc-cadmium efflux system membrane fusion protein
VLGWLLTALPTILALACLAGIGAWGYWTDWTLPKFGELTGEEKKEDEDWCKKHGAPESCCVECKPDLLPSPPKYGWCKRHGVHDCTLEHPDVAQLPTPPQVSEADRLRADRALKFAPRKENDDDCPLHPKRIQLASWQAMERAGIKRAKVETGPMTEAVTAPGEILYNPTRMARVSSRVPGTVRKVLAPVGAQVRRGDVLVLVESADVGRAKVDFLQAAAQLNLRTATLERMQKLQGVVPQARMLEVQTAQQEAKIRLLGAEQALANLGLQVHPEEFRGLEPEELARRVRLLGLPPDVIQSLDDKLTAANLLPVRAPQDGEVVARLVGAGEATDSTKVIIVLADTHNLWVMLNVRQEDAGRLALGQKIQFRSEDGGPSVEAAISWISPSVDPKTRTVQVRAELPNPKGSLRANTFGTGSVILRQEEHAVRVPNNAVHSDGKCQVVFVLDKGSRSENAPVVFHVRSVRTGARDNQNTEIIAGLIPGERIATQGSETLRGKLLLKDSSDGD